MEAPSFGTGIHQHYGRTPYWEHDVTDAGDYVGDDRQTNRSLEYESVTGYRAGGRDLNVTKGKQGKRQWQIFQL